MHTGRHGRLNQMRSSRSSSISLGSSAAAAPVATSTTRLCHSRTKCGISRTAVTRMMWNLCRLRSQCRDCGSQTWRDVTGLWSLTVREQMVLACAAHPHMHPQPHVRFGSDWERQKDTHGPICTIWRASQTRRALNAPYAPAGGVLFALKPPVLIGFLRN